MIPTAPPETILSCFCPPGLEVSWNYGNICIWEYLDKAGHHTKVTQFNLGTGAPDLEPFGKGLQCFTSFFPHSGL